MKKNVIVGLIGIGAICLAAPTMAADANSGEEVTIVTVDYKGKPPFKRRTETLPMADVAALDAAKTTRISTVDKANQRENATVLSRFVCARVAFW